VRHGLCGRTFFLLADEDPAAFEEHEAVWLAAWRPCDLPEHEAALAAIRCLWREERADRLEVQVLTDLFGPDRIADEAERQAAKDRAFKGLAMLMRYCARIEREHRAARQALDSLRQHRLARAAAAARPSEPEPAGPARPAAAVPRTAPALVPGAVAPAVRSEPEPAPALNRHQRRALAAMDRRRAV
jgi:hypothetical protein